LAPPSPASVMRRGESATAVSNRADDDVPQASTRVIGRFAQALHTAMGGVRSSAARRFLGSSSSSSDASSSGERQHFSALEDRDGALGGQENAHADDGDSDAGDWSKLNRRRHSAAPCEPFFDPKVSLEASSFSLQPLPRAPGGSVGGARQGDGSFNRGPPSSQPSSNNTALVRTDSVVYGGGLDMEDEQHSSAVLASLFNDVDSFQRSTSSAMGGLESSARRVVSGSISKRLLVSPPISLARLMPSQPLEMPPTPSAPGKRVVARASVYSESGKAHHASKESTPMKSVRVRPVQSATNGPHGG
jgi:hypothetical protein